MSLSKPNSGKLEDLTHANNADKSIAYIDAESEERTPGDFSTKLEVTCEQTDIQGKLNNTTKSLGSPGIEREKRSIPETEPSEIPNGCERQTTNLGLLHTESGIHDNGRENITTKFEDRVAGKDLPKQAVVEETTQLPKLNSVGDSAMDTEQNSLENQNTVGQSGSDFDPRIISKNGEEQLRHENPITVIETCQSSDANKNKSDEKCENSVAVEKRDSSSLNLAISKEPQLIQGNAKTAEVPETLASCRQPTMTKDCSNNVKLIPASDLGYLEKDCHNFNNGKMTKDQSAILDNSKINILTPTPSPPILVNNGTPYLNQENANVQLYESSNSVNLRTTQETSYVHMSQSSSTRAVQTKPSVPLLPKISADNSRLYQNSRFSQPVYSSTRPILPNIQRPTDNSTSLQRASGSYIDNSTLFQNKYVNEINQTNQINLYNANQNNSDANARPLNLTDTRSKPAPNNCKITNPNRFEIQNMLQQNYQPTIQSVTSLNLPVNSKEHFEYDHRFSFPTTPGINNGLSHNQRSYFKSYNGQSMQYAVHPENSNLRRNSLCDRAYAVGNAANNNQTASNFSVQQFQQYANQFGSQYLFMLPNPSDQITGTDKLRMSQPSTNQGIVPSYQQPCKNIFPNPVNNNVYLNPNDGKLCKSQFADGRMGFYLEQNQANIANNSISHERIHQQQMLLQPIQRTDNTNEKVVPTSHGEIFRNRDNNNNNNNNNNNTYPVSQNTLQWGRSSQQVHHENSAGQNGNDLKTKIPHESLPSALSSARSQAPNSHFQRSSFDHRYPEQHFPLKNADSFPTSDQITPSPKIQNSTRSQLKTGHSQYSMGSRSNSPNLVISNFQGPRITTTTTIPATSTTLEAQKKANTSIRDGPRLTSGQHAEPQRYQNNFTEFSTGRSGQSMPTYYTQPTMKNSGTLGQFPPLDTNTIRQNYANSSTSDKGQRANNPDSILSWSQYYPQCFDPTKPLHSRGYINYDSQQREQNLTPFNAQQNNINSPFYVSQSYNYKQQHLSTADSYQETPKPSNISNSVSKCSNLVTTYNYMQHNPPTSSFDRRSSNEETAHDYSHQNPSISDSLSTDSNAITTYSNSNVNCPTFENVRTENQHKVASEKLPVSQEISYNMAADKETLKAKIPQTMEEFPAETETNKPKSAGSEQFQKSICASGLYPKNVEISVESIKSEHTLPPLSVSGSLSKPDDFLSKTLTNQNPGMTSEESFLFSDFDPLFTSSLLTNELEYFPETNAAFDQCFEDAVSVTMAMVALNESRVQEIVDPSQVHALQQQQLTPLLNIISNNNNGGSSLTDGPSSRIQFNQVPTSQITLGSNQISNQYDSGVDTNKHLALLANKSNESMIGYIPGVDLLTLSSKTSRSGIDKSTSAYQNDSAQSGFPDLYNINSASHVAIPIHYNTSETKLVNTKDVNAKLCNSGAGIKRRNRQKSVELKGPPKRRGRPPKNPPVEFINNCPPAQSGSKQERATIQKPAMSSNTGTDTVEKIIPRKNPNLSGQVATNPSVTPKFSMTNASPTFPVCANLSSESEILAYCVGTDTVDLCITNKIDPQKSGALSSENGGGNSFASTKSNRELSEREVIDAVTKCLESISRNEEQNPDQILEGQLDTNSESVSPLDCTSLVGMDSTTETEAISLEDEALSKEETLMKAYIELKKKLEERMSRTLWRQSYLKRHEPKNPKYSRKLSKKECMTAYLGTTSLGPDDNVFSRYPNRSASNDGEDLVNEVDSTSIPTDINSGTKKGLSNKKNLIKIETEPVKDPASTQDQIPVSNDQQISSSEVSDPKKSIASQLPSMAEVVRTRLSNETQSLNTTNPRPLASEVSEESPVPNRNIPIELAESVENPNQLEMVLYNEDGSVNNLQPQQPGLSPRHLPLQPYSSSPLLPPPPPPPMPLKVVHCMSKREKKVGPTIVENAKNCFEAIGNYLTKADSDFDSFLITYANIVQGLLNCKAGRYSRIKSILLNRPKLELDAGITGEEKNLKEPLVSNRDIDASDIKGDADRKEDEIDVDDFNSSYADVVKTILSSRVDEYRNIKQALSKHISGFTDLCQWPTSNLTKRINETGVNFDVPVSPLTGCDDKSSVAPSQVEKPADSDARDTPSSVISEVNNVALSKDKQNSKEIRGQMLTNLASKKLQKRKIEEHPEDIVNDGILAMKASKKAPRRRGKKLSKTGSVMKDRKRVSFDENENSSGFRIILSSNSFIEQSESYSDSNLKLKPDLNVEKDENPESRRPVSSDDGFVEESTGDYIMNIDSESGGETKVPATYDNESSNGKDQPKLDALRNSNILRNAQPETVGKKASRNIPSLESSMDTPLNDKDGFSDETLQLSVDEIVTVNAKNTKTVRRQRSSRRSAGVGAIKCPCGCCDNEDSLKSDSLVDDLRVNTSFRKRNRAKIIKPKRANPLKRRGRSQKMETRSQKKIFPLVNHNGDATPIRSDDEEPSDINMLEDIKRFAVTNKPSPIPVSSDEQNNFKIRRELNSKLVLNLESKDSSDDDVFTNRASDDSDDKRNVGKTAKNKTKKSTQKNQVDLRYEFLHNRKASFIVDDTTMISAGENKTKTDEENETSTNDSSLNPNPGCQSLENSKDVNTSFKEFRREKCVSKARISFKEFVPNITSTPLANIPKENLGCKYADSCDSIENYSGSNVSNIKVTSKDISPSSDREGGDRIGLTAQGVGLNLTDNDAVRDFKTDVNVDPPSNSDNANFRPQDGDGRIKTSDKQNETDSCEDHLKSLIQTIIEINKTTKQINEDRSNVGGNELERLERGHFGLQSRDEMRVKTIIVDRIDETIDCQIGANDMDGDSSITSSDSCSDRLSGRLSGSSGCEDEDPRNSMDESHSLSEKMEVKLPSPLNARKGKQNHKVTSVGYENKIIIRKTWQEKTKKFHNLKRQTKNIFDILSSNETEEDTRGFARDLKKGTRKKKLHSDKKALSIASVAKEPERVRRSKSKMHRTKNGTLKNEDQNIDSDPEKLCLSLPQNGYDKSLIPSEKIKYPEGNHLKDIKDLKKKKKKITKSYFTDLKTLPKSEGLYSSGSNQKDISERSQTDTKLVIRDSFKQQVLDSKIKPEKHSKISKTGSCEPSFNQQKIRVSKRKKRRTSFEERNNYLVSTDAKMESTQRLPVNAIISRRTGEITDKPYPGPNFHTPLKRESSLNTQGGKDQSKLKQSPIDFPGLQCTFCPRYFKRPSELLYHTRTHTGERPFPCDQCKKSFASNAALRRHRRTHSSERTHICETCGRGFVQHYAMLVHQLIHSGLKPHKCSDCPNAFRTKGSLSSHRRRQHPE